MYANCQRCFRQIGKSFVLKFSFSRKNKPVNLTCISHSNNASHECKGKVHEKWTCPVLCALHKITSKYRHTLCYLFTCKLNCPLTSYCEFALCFFQNAASQTKEIEKTKSKTSPPANG